MRRNLKLSMPYPISWILFIIILFSPIPPVWGETEASDHYRNGLAFSQKKSWAEAEKEFSKAISLDPRHALAHANLGVALSQAGKHKEALLAFEEALKLGYDHPYFRYNRGISFASLNLIDEAVQELETALKMDSRMVKAVYHQGLLYLRQGRKEDARKMGDTLYKRNQKLAQKLFEQIPSGYKIASVNNGGRLAGKVTLTGPVPAARTFHMIHAPNIEYCSRMSDGKGHRLLYDFTVSENRGLKDTIIMISGIQKGKPFNKEIQTLKFALCHSKKYVIGVNNGETIFLENTDPIRHEIATYEVTKDGYKTQKTNKPLPGKSTQGRQVFLQKDSTEFLIKCNLHPFLQTRALLVNNPYFAISDGQGHFSITDIPPGTYEVQAWHPFIPNQKKTITVKAGEETELNFEYNGEDERRRIYHDDIIGYRFQPWFDSFEKFYGGKRMDDPVEVLQKF